MLRRSRSQVFVITGASDGIGAELAMQLAERGHRLALAARDEAKLKAVAGQCQRGGSMAVAVPTDVTAEADCRRLVERTLEAFGRIDVLVNNAGISMHADFDEITDWSTFERLWRVNCLGTVNCTRFAWPHLKAAPGKRGGQVVGVSSLAGRTGVPGRTTYCASKFAQTGFLEALRIEAAAHGIAVTVVYPGVVATGIRSRGLDGRGEPAGVSRLDERGAMPVEECARRMARAIEGRRRELVMTARGRLGLWLKLVAPGWVDHMARRALNGEKAR
ncbi:MAG: SDR family oxidoreductase [Burkholderiaceae bacterium]|nr:SDR family oxidoreductase [Burkholderiaceae bacterium]